MVDGKSIWLGRALVASLLMLGGCSAANPVNWYRSAAGETQHDTDANAPNAANLAAGSQQPYPSLASVPAPPERGLTTAQRAALADGLIADRAHARYAATQIQDDDASAVMAAQIPLPEETPPPAEPVAPVPQTAALPPVSTGPLLGPPIVSHKPRKHAPVAAPVAAPSSDNGLSAGGVLGDVAPPSPAPAPAPASDDGLSAGGALVGGAAPAPAAPAPTAPQPRVTPQPEVAQAPPPAPSLPPLPPPQKPKKAAGLPAPAAGAAPSTGTAAPEQAVAVPIAPALPAPAQAAKPVAHAAPKTLGGIDFADGSIVLPPGADRTIADAARQYHQQGGTLRVVGFGPATVAGSDPTTAALASDQAALANADAVKQALVAAGVPASAIATEAAPNPAKTGHADIILLP